MAGVTRFVPTMMGAMSVPVVKDILPLPTTQPASVSVYKQQLTY